MQRNNQPKKSSVLFEVIRSDGYLSTSKALIRELGLNTAVLLSDLIAKQVYFEDRNMLESGWFFNTEPNREWDTGLSPYQQRKCINELEKMGLLKQKRQGIPAKQWFKLDEDKIEQVIRSHKENKNKSFRNLRTGHLKNKDRSFKKQELFNENKPNENKPNENNNTPSYNLEDLKPLNSNPLNFPKINKLSKTPKKLNGKIMPKQFDEFWSLYPKREGGQGSKGKAKTKWDKLCCSKNGDIPTWRQIKGAIIRQMKSEQWQNPKYIPMATTWLNNNRWLDDPKELQTFVPDEQKKKLGPDEDPNFYADGNYAKPKPGKYAKVPVIHYDSAKGVIKE